VVYTTTGVFNFAQGAIGVFAAFLYWELHVNRGWHSVLALVVVVGMFAPTLGVLLDIVIMRRLRTASLVVQLMVTVAIMVLLLSVVGDIWEADTARRVPYLFGIENGIGNLVRHLVGMAVGNRLGGKKRGLRHGFQQRSGKTVDYTRAPPVRCCASTACGSRGLHGVCYAARSKSKCSHFVRLPSLGGRFRLQRWPRLSSTAAAIEITSERRD